MGIISRVCRSGKTRQGEEETRRQGEFSLPVSLSPCLLLSLSPTPRSPAFLLLLFLLARADAREFTNDFSLQAAEHPVAAHQASHHGFHFDILLEQFIDVFDLIAAAHRDAAA